MIYHKPRLVPLDLRADLAFCKPSSRPCYGYALPTGQYVCYLGRGVNVNGGGGSSPTITVTPPVPVPDAQVQLPEFVAPALVLP